MDKKHGAGNNRGFLQGRPGEDLPGVSLRRVRVPDAELRLVRALEILLASPVSPDEQVEGQGPGSGNDEDVRTLSMVLDVRYLPVGEAEISHSNLITILDTQGRVVHKIQGTSVNLNSAVEYLR